MRIVTRAEWAARSPKSPPTHVPLSARTATCTHHDGATPVIVHNFSDACNRVRQDQSFHMDSNGWNDIGYNYLVISAPGTDVDGLIFEGRGRDVVGAHCLNWNTPWIGIQVAIGGAQVPSPAALASVRELHASLEVAARRTLAKKVHSDGFNTACPGPILKAWVHSGMPVTTAPTGDAPMSAAEVQTVVAAIAGHDKKELARYSDRVRADAAQTAQIAALTRTIEALAAGHPGVDPKALLAAVTVAATAAVKEAMVDFKITLETVP